jgi:hypothetical protein
MSYKYDVFSGKIIYGYLWWMSNYQDYRRVIWLMWSLQKRPLSFDVWRPASKGGYGLATWLPGGLAGPSPSALSKPRGYPIGFAAKMEDDPDWPIESRTWWPILGHKPKKSVGFLHVVTWSFRNVSDFVISSQTVLKLWPNGCVDLRGIWTELCIASKFDPKWSRPPTICHCCHCVIPIPSHGWHILTSFFRGNQIGNRFLPWWNKNDSLFWRSISPRNATGE